MEFVLDRLFGSAGESHGDEKVSGACIEQSAGYRKFVFRSLISRICFIERGGKANSS